MVSLNNTYLCIRTDDYTIYNIGKTSHKLRLDL